MYMDIVNTTSHITGFPLPNAFMVYYIGALVDLNVQLQEWVCHVFNFNALQYLITG